MAKKDSTWLGRIFNSKQGAAAAIHNPDLECDIQKTGGFQPNQTDFNRPSNEMAARIRTVKSNASKRRIIR